MKNLSKPVYNLETCLDILDWFDDPDYDYWSVNKNANQYIASKTVTPSYYQKADFWRVKDVMLSYSLPGKGNDAGDQETFIFPAGIKARLLRVSLHGCRMGQGSGSTNANAYWKMEVKTR